MADLTKDPLEFRAMLDAMRDIGVQEFKDIFAVERAYEVTFE